MAQQYKWYAVTSPGTADPSTNGANITWNLATATLTQLGTAVWKSAAGTPYAANYPDATHVIEYIVTGGVTFSFSYFKVTPTGIEIVARDVTASSSVDYTDYKRILMLSFAYLSNWTDSYTISGGSPVSVTYSCTAYGNIISSIGLFNGVLKLTTSEGDIIFWNRTPFSPLLQLPSSGAPYVLEPITVGMDEAQPLAALQVYPNPAEDRLWLTGTSDVTNWVVVDAMGRQLASGTVPAGQDRAEIAVDALPSGVYRLFVEAAGARRTLPFVRQ